MTEPDREEDRRRAMDRMIMDYPVELTRLPDALRTDGDEEPQPAE